MNLELKNIHIHFFYFEIFQNKDFQKYNPNYPKKKKTINS